MDARIQLDRTTAEDARRAQGWSVRQKTNRDSRVAPQGRTRYFRLQPSLPLNQATLVRGAFSVISAGASRSDSIDKGALEHKLYATSASGIEYCKPRCM